MLHCHQCDKKIGPNTSVQRVLRTGIGTGGNGHFRTVNLCFRCDDKRLSADRQAHIKNAVLILTGVAAVIGGATYFWFYR